MLLLLLFLVDLHHFGQDLVESAFDLGQPIEFRLRHFLVQRGLVAVLAPWNRPAR